MFADLDKSGVRDWRCLSLLPLPAFNPLRIIGSGAAILQYPVRFIEVAAKQGNWLPGGQGSVFSIRRDRALQVSLVV
jgi:hypothetical protein